MKRVYYLIFALAIANIAICASAQGSWDEPYPYDPMQVEFDEEEDIMMSNIVSPCVEGGPGSTSCSISGDVAGTGVSCSVTCAGAKYACCGLTCTCVDITHIHLNPDF